MIKECFIFSYYSKDEAVETDGELQSFANELSIDGKVKPDGGKGKVVSLINLTNELFLVKNVVNINLTEAHYNFLAYFGGKHVNTPSFNLNRNFKLLNEKHVFNAVTL